MKKSILSLLLLGTLFFTVQLSDGDLSEAPPASYAAEGPQNDRGPDPL